MKLLVVTHYYPAHGGGVEVIADELISRLVSRGVCITWAASAPHGMCSIDGLSLLPMPCLNISERRLGIPYPLWSPAAIPALLNAVRNCDILHLHDSLYMGNVLAYLFARLLRKPIVVTQHIGLVPYSNRLARWLHRGANATLARWVLSGSHQTVFYSEKVRRYFSGGVHFRIDPAHIVNGVDTSTFAPTRLFERNTFGKRFGFPTHKRVLLFVGRFVEKKGLHIIRSLASRFSDCHWALAGAGPIDPAAWGLANVQAMGWIDHADLPSLYSAADLLVLPSVGEGFPLVVQEAMACGTPVLISDDTAAGCPGIEKVAFVAEPSEQKMTALLGAIISDPAMLSGRRTVVADYAVRQWDWDVCVSCYMDVFDRLARRTANAIAIGAENSCAQDRLADRDFRDIPANGGTY